MWETVDALVSIEAPENTRELAAVPVERLTRYQRGLRPHQRARSSTRPQVGRLPVSDARAGAGRRSDAARRSPTSSTAPACSTGTRRRERMSRYAERFEAADEVRIVGERHRRAPVDRRAAGKVDAGGANMPGGEFFYLAGRGLGRGRDRLRRVPGGLRRPRGRRHPAPLRGREGRRCLGRDERGVPARAARPRRGGEPPGRARDRLQPGDHAPHEEHALRREDRRHRPSRARQRPPRRGRHEREPAPLGHRQGDASGGPRIELDGETVQENGRWLV